MRTQFSKIALAAALGFAITSTFFACSGDSPSEPPNGEPSSSSIGSVKLCGNVEYDDSIYRCESGELIGKCKGVDFYPAYQVCNNGVIEDKVSESSSSSFAVSEVSSSSNGSSSITQSSSSSGSISGTFTDSRDNKIYKWVKIGTQTWMAENLNYNATDSECYDNINANCTTYGRLYDWATAMGFSSICNSGSCLANKPKGVCPSGWHIPGNAEWDALMTAVGGSSTAGIKLKSTSGWSNDGNGTDDFGFSALPGGNRYSSGSFYGVGSNGNWWSATEDNADGAYLRHMSYGESVGYYGDYKNYLFSVRCLKD